MKVALNVGLIVLILAGLIWWGRSASNTGADQIGGESVLVASAAMYDFGEVSMAKGKVDTTFTIKNPTNTEVKLASIVTSCMCTTAYIEDGGSEKGPFGMPGHGGPVPKANVILKPGEERVLRIQYDPNAHGPAGVGAIDRFVFLTDSLGRELQLEIKAIVTP